MTSQLRSKLVSVFVFTLVLGTLPSSYLRAQWVYPLAHGVTRRSIEGSAPLSCRLRSGNIAFRLRLIRTARLRLMARATSSGFPMYGYAESLGQVPLTTTSFSSLSNTVTLVPGWGGSTHGVYRRHRPRPSVPLAANQR